MNASAGYHRVIPCLDVKNGRVVKGVRFVQLRDAGDPLEIARRYDEQGADELTFLDITATTEGRELILPVIQAVAAAISIPLTVGGGVRSLDDVGRLLDAGAARVSIGSAAIARPELMHEAAQKYGSARLVAAVDASQRKAADLTARGPGWDVLSHGGGKNTGRDVVVWAQTLAAQGAGEILLTSLDKDGTRSGFDLELTRTVSQAIDIPVTASGGAGTAEQMADGVSLGGADAVLAASIFHFGEVRIAEVKQCLQRRGLPVKMSRLSQGF